MSYLDNLRMVFAGQFQADTSTVNNDVRHFDNATFEARFQDYQRGPVMNGWWNPIGSGAFRLIGCQVQSVQYTDGTGTTEAADDPAVGLYVSGSDNQVGGKIVDLDPQWQMSSQLWGLDVRLGDGKGPDVLASAFEPAAFRDILFGRQQQGNASGDQNASAIFQSVLTGLEWDESFEQSRFFRELHEAAANGLLSIHLNTFGVSLDRTAADFTIGTMIGAIGPYREGEPRSFNLGRRMVPANGQSSPVGNFILNFFDCRVDMQEQAVFADLGNSLPLADGQGGLVDVGDLQLAMLLDPSTAQGQSVTKGTGFTPLGGLIPYRDAGWFPQTAGIWAVEMGGDLPALINQRPLALLQMSGSQTGTVVIRESADGWMVRADNFVQRTDPATQPAAVDLYAAVYGEPLLNHGIDVAVMPPIPGMGGGSPSDPDPPQAPIPVINRPRSAVTLNTPLQTGSDGRATLSITTTAPGNPRGYVDGQIYMIRYPLADQAPNQQQGQDFVVVLLWDEYEVPDQPTWVDDIQPILTQYGNLYPIMSQQLIDLGNYEAVVANRAILELVFSLDPSDANYMPVTRDLSANKVATILKWLRQQNPDGTYALVHGGTPGEEAAVAEAAPVPAAAAAPAATETLGGKTQFHRNFEAARKAAEDQ